MACSADPLGRSKDRISTYFHFGIGGMSPVVNIPGLNHAFEITKSGMITRVFKRRPIDAQHVDVGDTRGMMCKFWRVGISKRKLRQERFIMVYTCWFCRLHFWNFWSLVACAAIVEWPLTLMIFSAVSPFPVAPSFGGHDHYLAQQTVPGTWILDSVIGQASVSGISWAAQRMRKSPGKMIFLW